MKLYINIGLVVLFVILITTISCLMDDNISKGKEITRFAKNIEALTSDNQTWESKSGIQIMTIKEMEVTQEELVKLRLADLKMIDDLNIKIKRLKEVTQTGATTNISIAPHVKDTLIKRDTIIIPCKNISYKDSYVKISGLICDSSSSKLDIQHTDTLITIVQAIPKQFLFIKYGVKELRQEVFSKSPYSIIFYSQTVKVK